MNAVATVLDENDASVQTVRILIVEDERIVARSLQDHLTALGYEVVECVASGEEAIRQTEEHLPNLVLMDIHLDGPMDGVEAAAIIRAQFRVPVVYLTAYSNMEILERAKLTEPFGYILKPYEDRELHVIIEMALYKHRMEQRQQERERWFAATLKSIGDGVIATDEEGRITYMNPVAERLTGWASQDALNQTLNHVVKLVHADSRQSVETKPGEATQEAPASTGILLVAQDDSEKAIENRVSLITDEQGDIVGKVVVLRDVTWRQHLEDELRQATKMKAIGQLAGGLAHALNNLMTTVLGYSEIMLKNMKPDNAHFAGAEEIKRAATRTATLTQKLLAFGGKQLLTLRPVDLNTVVGRLARIIENMQSGVRLDLNLESALGSINADPDQLEETILTLVRNACGAMPHGGRVAIQSAHVELGQEYTRQHPEVRPGQYVLLAVSDTGVGMNQKAVSQLFEPFYTTEAGVGAGLGLAAAYGFVKQCGGEIEVQSQPERGTTFRLFFPR